MINTYSYLRKMDLNSLIHDRKLFTQDAFDILQFTVENAGSVSASSQQILECLIKFFLINGGINIGLPHINKAYQVMIGEALYVNDGRLSKYARSLAIEKGIREPDFDRCQQLYSDILERSLSTDNLHNGWQQDWINIKAGLKECIAPLALEEEDQFIVTSRFYEALALFSTRLRLYLPKCDALRSEIRSHQIVDEFDGRNVQALAKKHSFSATQVYRILRAHSSAKKRA